MKTPIALVLLTFILITALQIRLSHDNKKGYSYTISGSSTEEIVEADQKMKQYLKSLVPKKNAGPAPPVSAPKPAPIRK